MILTPFIWIIFSEEEQCMGVQCLIVAFLLFACALVWSLG